SGPRSTRRASSTPTSCPADRPAAGAAPGMRRLPRERPAESDLVITLGAMRPSPRLVALPVAGAVLAAVAVAAPMGAAAAPARAAVITPASAAAITPASQEATTPAPTGVVALGAYLADTATGLKLWGRDPNTKRPMGSITKVMTALIVIQAGNLGRKITVPASAVTYVASHGASTAGLRAGDVVTARQLLNAMLLPS